MTSIKTMAVGKTSTSKAKAARKMCLRPRGGREGGREGREGGGDSWKMEYGQFDLHRINEDEKKERNE
jgi:hypothetical protein